MIKSLMNSQTRFDAIKSKDFPGGDRVVIHVETAPHTTGEIVDAPVMSR
jgi:hypothetical protein